MIKKVLSIAGSDSGGGAGIQADLKTFQEFGTFGLTCITSIMAFNPDNHQYTLTPMSEQLIHQQLLNNFAGGSLDAIKTGLLGHPAVAERIHYFIQTYGQKKLIVDPVLVGKGPSDLLQQENIHALSHYLLPKATIVTPNLIEAGILSEQGEITSIDQLKKSARSLYQLGPASVLIKGGNRLPGEMAIDLLYDGTDYTFFKSPKVNTSSNHGAGCSFSAALTACLARNIPLKEAIALAKDYVTSGIQQGVFLTPDIGYLWHGHYYQTDQRLTSKEEHHETN
ncbi:bifunctional hydroxymethylpyrimidine kinase/phosphomethylpyrimidine kinase [Vagococcus humatus]|uniref:pyridoxal kinase n=1 Tax=Vagococcus humatus TaxID=1889241 RepID=A0A3R9YEN7_9ENTE|nr:bifunctional hydroxymethylpyrimidine kinase/phosphomethylpyrimidine kinase [Vagococcus humatus]RST89521.1 bifunctional hydroxymethylpyrimidine kinase/phosphomethylpyrimidine kinase [Vagococcus humatus]